MMTGRSQETAFASRVHAKLNTYDYEEFLKFLGLFSEEIITQSELESKVCFYADLSFVSGW